MTMSIVNSMYILSLSFFPLPSLHSALLRSNSDGARLLTVEEHRKVSSVGKDNVHWVSLRVVDLCAEKGDCIASVVKSNSKLLAVDVRVVGLFHLFIVSVIRGSSMSGNTKLQLSISFLT